MDKVVVVGLGKSGIAAAEILSARGDTVFISELKDSDAVRADVKALIKKGIVSEGNIELGAHSEKIIAGAKSMVISPGVRQDSLPVRMAERSGIPVIGEMELAYSMCPAPIIAITGTSGKTTVTTLIGNMLKKAGRHAVVCGNIGNPLSGELKKIRKDSIVVLEVSSFQLERIKDFKPRVSVVLNVSENHLDRHSGMEEYVSLKSRIFSNQDKDGIVFLNGNDRILKKLSRDIKNTKVEFFNEYKDFKKRLGIKNENYLAAMSVVSTELVSEDVMLEALSGFKGIPHRLEHVGVVDGVDFYNDSKATTVSSVEWALKSLEGRIALIMGGKYKGGDFGSLRRLIDEKVSCVIVMGKAGGRIKKDLTGFPALIEAETLEGALQEAFKKTAAGGKVLLSPGCSSFDIFESYKERGELFKKYVKELASGFTLS
ncbi:MAG: UDP-N-acetylmuramoyl-L-alanine--D-glutamate ligase [Candidatus Omnitrophica bacterium]|nr:UDP-N-acetylmuramoyl-L-alanine--D-glutamate ligase [Candidatus Omnitrophota bacterium]